MLDVLHVGREHLHIGEPSVGHVGEVQFVERLPTVQQSLRCGASEAYLLTDDCFGVLARLAVWLRLEILFESVSLEVHFNSDKSFACYCRMSCNATLEVTASRLRRKPSVQHQTSSLLEFSTALLKNSEAYATAPGPLDVPELSQMIAQRTNQLMKELREKQQGRLPDSDDIRNRNATSALASYSRSTKLPQSKPKRKKEPVSNQSESIALSKYEQLLKQILQKEDMLRDVNERLEQRSSEF